MPRVYRTQKQFEQFLIREFAAQLGYRIVSSIWQERPDCILTLAKGKWRGRIGIEHTEYFSDTAAGKPSPLSPLKDFWKAVQSSLVRRISHRTGFAGFQATVHFKERLALPPKTRELAKVLAKELVSFVNVYRGEERKWHRFKHDAFAHHPTMALVLSELRLWWTADVTLAPRMAWTCSNLSTGMVGLNREYLVSTIAVKSKKAAKYDWGESEEKWLLIAASGNIVSNVAGPVLTNAHLSNPELVRVCQSAPFDQIALWDYPSGITRWLKRL